MVSKVGVKDRRERHLFLTDDGRDLERVLSEAHRKRMRAAYREAGPEAVAGFQHVLQQIMDPKLREHFEQLKDGS